MIKFEFEKLIIWQDVLDFSEVINEISKKISDRQKFNLSPQIIKAADSIALTISEGSIGQSNLEQRKFISYSMRSLAEVVSFLFKVKRRIYIKEETFTECYVTTFYLMNKMADQKTN